MMDFWWSWRFGEATLAGAVVEGGGMIDSRFPLTRCFVGCCRLWGVRRFLSKFGRVGSLTNVRSVFSQLKFPRSNLPCRVLGYRLCAVHENGKED